MSDTDKHSSGEEFTKLLLQNQKRIYGLILSLIPMGSDADDIMQEACSIMWKKFSEFEKDTNFSAWALKIARFQVMTYYNQTRRHRAKLSEESMEVLAETLAATEIKTSERSESLKECLSKLSEKNQEMILLRYQESFSIQEIADKMGRSTHALYKALNRSFSQLHRCMTQV